MADGWCVMPREIDYEGMSIRRSRDRREWAEQERRARQEFAVSLVSFCCLLAMLLIAKAVM